MKQTYETPLVEVVHIGQYLESFCGISGGEYTGQSVRFDDDSD